LGGERKRDGNTEVTEVGTQRAQRKKDKDNAEAQRTQRFAEEEKRDGGVRS